MQVVIPPDNRAAARKTMFILIQEITALPITMPQTIARAVTTISKEAVITRLLETITVLRAIMIMPTPKRKTTHQGKIKVVIPSSQTTSMILTLTMMIITITPMHLVSEDFIHPIIIGGITIHFLLTATFTTTIR